MAPNVIDAPTPSGHILCTANAHDEKGFRVRDSRLAWRPLTGAGRRLGAIAPWQPQGPPEEAMAAEGRDDAAALASGRKGEGPQRAGAVHQQEY